LECAGISLILWFLGIFLMEFHQLRQSSSISIHPINIF
jgi:hypothetical protein